MDKSKSWEQLMQLVQYLSHLGREPHHTFRQSIINDLMEHGYSAERAEQVVDELERHVIQLA